MHVEEHRAIAFAERAAVDALERSTNRVERPRRDVAGNDGIRHTGEAAMPEVDIGAAHFGARRSKKRALRGKVGPWELSNLDRLARRGHHRGQDAGFHGRTLLCGCALPHLFSRRPDALCRVFARERADL